MHMEKVHKARVRLYFDAVRNLALTPGYVSSATPERLDVLHSVPSAGFAVHGSPNYSISTLAKHGLVWHISEAFALKWVLRR